MNKDQAILIHDVASLTFLAPFSVLCLAETLFGYTRVSHVFDSCSHYIYVV